MLSYNKIKLKKYLFFIGIILIIFYFLITYQTSKKNNNLEVSFIDSGQADAIFIKTPNQKNIIIDFGSEQGLKQLEKEIEWWNKQIDLIIITHPHDDHITGLLPIIKKYKIKQIMYNGLDYESNVYNELLNLITEYNIPLLLPNYNQIINIEPDCFLNIIYPITSFYQQTIDNINNSSIVSRLVCNNSSFLFMGDVETKIENEILATNLNIKSDVIKISHHGSVTASSEKFLEKVDPKIAIIMVGKNNNFNHPSLRLIKRLDKLNIKLFRTDQDGTIKIISDGKKIYKSN